MSEEKIHEICESDLIRLITQGRVPSGPEVIIDNGDDAAVWRVEDPEALQIVSTDSLVEGVHFTELNENTGRKLMTVNLSDLASMGASPSYALLSVHFDRCVNVASVQAMARGLHSRAHEFGVQLIGGNVTRTSGPAVLALTLFGTAKTVIARGSALTGNDIFVTGTLGDARAGLDCVEGFLFLAQVDPEPRVELGRALAESGVVTSMCDVSDGLGSDLAQLLCSAGQGATIFRDALPISDELKAHAEEKVFDYALSGGEDYELLFTAGDAEQIQDLAERLKVRISRIGVVTDSGKLELLGSRGEIGPLPMGFDHFDAAGQRTS